MIIEQIELTNDFELIFGSYFINHYQGNLQICRFFLQNKKHPLREHLLLLLLLLLL